MMAIPFREKNDDWSDTLTILWHDRFQRNKLRGIQWTLPKGQKFLAHESIINTKKLSFESLFHTGKQQSTCGTAPTHESG
jgi:hypothetical protein